MDAICRLYSGSADGGDMQVYAERAVYDDLWSYCDTRYKIAGQWYGRLFPNFLNAFLGGGAFGIYSTHDNVPVRCSELTISGIPIIMSSSKTLATEIVKSDDKEIAFKLR